jgi:8-oxoguanine deaminase
MSTLLIRNADLLVTMDKLGREIQGGSMLVRDGIIEQIGQEIEIPLHIDQVMDMSGSIVVPGLINTHHHFYQTLTRAVPEAQNANLFTWLKTLYPIWGRITPDDIHISTQTALAELALSGCTTASDHLYIFPNGSSLDDEILAAKEIGVRLHASRGSMSLGESDGGLPPDDIVEDEAFILGDSARVIEKYHDPGVGSFTQVVLAPCSPFSVTKNLMLESARLARHYGVHLHTHLAETKDEEEFCVNRFGLRPVALMETMNWIGADVWFAHSVYVNQAEIALYSSSGCGVAHCPSSNMRLASGIAPIRSMLKAGVKVGLGVDGSASNDGSHMLGEARQAMLLARLDAGLNGASYSNPESTKLDSNPLMTAREALYTATVGGALVLGRDDIGSLETGKCADFFTMKLDRLEYTGALHDPLAALVFCAPGHVDNTVVHGRPIVRDGQIQTIDLKDLIKKHNAAAKRLLSA